MSDRRNTLQKEIIHRTLCRMANHPTAAMVYEAVHRDHPTISRSTVYRVLGQMAEEGSVLRLGWLEATPATTATSTPTATPGAGLRRHRRHPAGGDRPPVGHSRFLLEDWTVEYSGLCPACRGPRRGRMIFG